MNKIRKFGIPFLLSLLWAGCTRSDVDPSPVGRILDPSKYITVTTTLPASRAALTDITTLTEFGFYCTYTGTDNWTGSEADGIRFNKMDNRKMVRGDGTSTGDYNYWTYEGAPVMWETGTTNDRYTFFAYAPYVSGTNTYGLTLYDPAEVTGIPSPKPGVPYIAYEVPAANSAQPDLMVAGIRANIRPTGNPVSMQMNHALTAVNFTVTGQQEEIESISLTGFYDKGILPLDGSGTWSRGSVGGGAFTAATAPATAAYTVPLRTTTAGSSNIVADDAWLMMIPQTLTEAATVTITFADSEDREPALLPLKDFHAAWEAGHKVTYAIAIQIDGTTTVAPATVVVPGLAIDSTTGSVNVTSLDKQNQPAALNWTLSVDSTAYPWLKLSLDAGDTFTNATYSVSATSASQTVYLYTSENSGVERTAKIQLNGVEEVTVTQRAKPVWYIPNTEPTAFKTYVGAFWQSGQKGERLIDIYVDEQSLGGWTASVIHTDGNWAANDIVFAVGGSADPNAGTSAAGDAESYPVTATTTAIVGHATQANGKIGFRIGLNSTYGGVRYAVVLLSYKDYSINQWILLRQGETADYLMPGSRTLARQIPPYNITVSNFKSGGTNDAVGTGSVDWTDFPTQAGALFRWAHREGVKAYNPVGDVSSSWTSSGTITGWWSSTAPNSPWKRVGEYYDACPSGYHRPNNGSISGGETSAPASGSEIAQSLWYTPADSDGDNGGNVVWGFYADGFFDRRQVKDETSVSGTNSSTVAYAGSLFYNPLPAVATANYASVFLPSTGYRTPALSGDAGTMGYYWLSSAYDSADGWASVVGYSGSRTARRMHMDRTYAMPVRCVADSPAGYPPDLEKPLPGGDW